MPTIEIYGTASLDADELHRRIAIQLKGAAYQKDVIIIKSKVPASDIDGRPHPYLRVYAAYDGFGDPEDIKRRLAPLGIKTAMHALEESIPEKKTPVSTE